MLAITDICRIVESGFPGFTCNCIATQGLLQIKVSEPASGDIKLQLNGVSPEHLVTIRDLSNFIGELRTEISAGRRAFAGQVIISAVETPERCATSRRWFSDCALRSADATCSR